MDIGYRYGTASIIFGEGGTLDWRELQKWLSGDLRDFSGEIAYRTVMRTLPLVADDLTKTWQSRQLQTPVLLNILRSLITVRVALDNPADNFRSQLENCIRPLSRVQAYDYIARSVRAMLLTVLSISRPEKFENLRKTIQVAKDATQNLPYAMRPRDEGFYALNVWEEVEKDIRNIDRAIASGDGIPFSVIDDRRDVSGAWTDFISHLSFYDQNWSPWVYWLEYRLFGVSNARYTDDDWKQIEHSLAEAPETEWVEITRINGLFERLLLAKDIGDEAPTSEEEASVEDQNRSALTFGVDDQGLIELDSSPGPAFKRIYDSEIYADLIESVNSLIDACVDNSSAYVKSKAMGYQESLQSLERRAGQVLMVARGDALRIILDTQESLDEVSDVAPLRDSTLALLKEVVGKHNILVGLEDSLSKIDKMLLGPDATEALLGGDEIHRLLTHPTTVWVMTSAAKEALTEIAEQAPAEPDPNSRLSRRASESGKNLIRSIIKALYNHRKKVLVSAMAVPPTLYALGKWALANEGILLKYFQGSPGMQKAVESILGWLHTLPLA